MRAAVTCLSLALTSPAYAAQTFGLVIGIDAYAHVTDLQGAVNDARDIADALETLDADVTLLLDGAASRAAVLSAWQNIYSRAAPGDTVIVTYAGHGSNEPEHTPGNEADGLDENFLLAGFAPHGAAAGERIRDDEIADLIAQRPDLTMIFVADACHSGTVTRNLNPTLGYRYVTPTPIADDPLPPPPPRPAPADDQDEVALFLAAVNETQKVPEYLIDGTARGALSYAFAEALRGDADADGDLTLTKGELETYVRRTVRDVSQGVQLPQSFPAGAVDEALFTLTGLPSPRPDMRTMAFDALPPIMLASDAALPPIAGLVPAAPAASADARYDTAQGHVTSMVGDRIARISRPEDLVAVIAKMRVANALGQISDPTLSLRFQDGDRTYADGDPVTAMITGRKSPNLTLLNIAASGEIALLYPLPDAGDPPTLPPAVPFALRLRVGAPFGADHVIAVDSQTSPDALRRTLRGLNGTADLPALWDALRSDPVHHIALFPFFSEEAP